jgi:hypothetical protein
MSVLRLSLARFAAMALPQQIYRHHCRGHGCRGHTCRCENRRSHRQRLGSVLLASLSLATWGALGPLPARANGVGDVVRSICMSVFKAEMQDAGKKAPAGMANYTCGCVTEQITSGSTIDGAKATCKQQASLRYPL